MALSTYGTHLDLAEICQLLESRDLGVLDQTITLVQDNLASVADSHLLNGLVDYYIQSGNNAARDVLCVIRQQQSKILLSRIEEHLQKGTTRLKALGLLGHIIRSEPIWIHHIVPSRAFPAVLKCLQTDMDLTTITSALYILVTLMPKVASQFCSHLPTLCTIFVRLVSWNTIKPEGASETNLIHSHTAVYALFLCLYGMYPCSFIKFLQQQLQRYKLNQGSTQKVSTTLKEKLRVFENSIQPMLDQVRFNIRLVTDGPDIETSNEKWRGLECHDIVAEINKISLDVTENRESKHKLTEKRIEEKKEKITRPTFQAERSDLKCIQYPSGNEGSIWSPSVAIGLSTPPLARAMSPTTSDYSDAHHLSSQMCDSFNESDCGDETKPSPVRRKPGSLTISSPDGSRQSASNGSTPLRSSLQNLYSPSSPQRVGEVLGKRRMNHQSGGDINQSFLGIRAETCKALPMVRARSCGADERTRNVDEKVSAARLQAQSEIAISSIRWPNDGNPPTADGAGFESRQADVDPSQPFSPPSQSASVVDDDDVGQFSPGLRPVSVETMTTDDVTSPPCSSDSFPSPFDMGGCAHARHVLTDDNEELCVEQSPNEVLDLHLQLMADAYLKFRNNKLPSNKDVEWRFGGEAGGEVGRANEYLRVQVLQAHSALLYERHRREQHALRARKIMRKLYDTAALEQRNATLSFEVKELRKDAENMRCTRNAVTDKLRQVTEQHALEMENMEDKLDVATCKLEQLDSDNLRLSAERSSLEADCEEFRTRASVAESQVFELNHQLQSARQNCSNVAFLEEKVKAQQQRIAELVRDNKQLREKQRRATDEMQARVAEAQSLMESFRDELEELQETSSQTRMRLAVSQLATADLKQQVTEKERVVAEQKLYLEHVKSLARGQIKAIESKYSAQKNTNQRLEIQVMELFGRLSSIEGDLAFHERTHLTSGPRSIQTISSAQVQEQKESAGVSTSASPQLSPPLPDSIIAESADLWKQRRGNTTHDAGDSRKSPAPS